MPFAYRLRKPAGAPRQRHSDPPAILVCDLGRPESRDLALTIATQLMETARRDVTLLSDLACVDASETLEPAGLDRTPVYEIFVAVENNRPMRLSSRLISAVVGLRISTVRRIGAKGRHGAYSRPAEDGTRRALFVFPGIFAPPRTGSHQRAFSTLLDLVEEGYDVDVLVKRTGRRLLDRVKPYLDLASPRVVSYEVDRSRTAEPEPPAPAPEEPEPEPTARPAGVFAALRARFATAPAKPENALPAPKEAPPPPAKPFMLEREAEDVDEAARALVAGMIAEGGYRLVVVTFPWMVSLLPDPLPQGVRLVCDTHDVITNRRRELAEDGDPIGDEALSLAAERAALAKCDAALAISKSDAKLFEETMGLSNVVVQPLTYHLGEPPLEWRSGGRALTFGFLGSDMPANRRALQFIMTRWWPIIERFSPESRLVVAGAISTSGAVSPYVILRRNVTIAGFVEDLNAFFGSIDVVLSPTIVQAGVNVKNVEALLRRRPVITNTLGAKSLAPLTIPTRCESDEGFLNILRKLDRNDPGLMAELEALFGEAVAYHSKPMRLGWA